MDKLLTHTALPAVTDVYTNLHGMEALKSEKNDDVALKKVAQQFESMFINMLLKNMRSANAVFEKDSMFNSQESGFYRDMHDNQLALTIAHGKGFGIADSLYRQLARTHGDGSAEIEPLAREVNTSTNTRLDKNAVKESAIENISIRDADKLNSADSTKADTEERLATLGPIGFIKRVYNDAVNAAEKLGVDPETLIAQAALETGWGRYVLSKEGGASSNNLFNIKADARWSGDSVGKDALEFLQGAFVPIKSEFRSYASIKESFEDFSQFILGSERYKDAVSLAKDGMDFIKGIHSAGYATDPDYVSKIEGVYSRVVEHTQSLKGEGEL